MSVYRQVAVALVGHAAGRANDDHLALSQYLGTLEDLEELRRAAGIVAIWFSEARGDQIERACPWLSHEAAVAEVAREAWQAAMECADAEHR